MELHEVFELMLVDHQSETVFPQGMVTPQTCLAQLYREGNKRNVRRKELNQRYMIFRNGVPYQEP